MHYAKFIIRVPSHKKLLRSCRGKKDVNTVYKADRKKAEIIKEESSMINISKRNHILCSCGACFKFTD
jgi:hypothetical protein